MEVGDVDPPLFTALLTLVTWFFFYFFGTVRDHLFWRRPAGGKGLAPLRQNIEDFYTRRAYGLIQDCWNRPISSAPDSWVTVQERTPLAGLQPLTRTGNERQCLNLGSYNYLGFAASDEYCTPRVLETLTSLGCSTCSSRSQAGTTPVHVEMEQALASYVGKEAAIIFGMGFATNSAVLPVLAGKGCLVISDSINHASIATGCKGSGARVQRFLHNNPQQLEEVLRQAIVRGQPRTHRPWRKIVIVIEGLYSMEGEIARLAEIVALKKKYKAYLYMDEAHSIGALGETGRGACEQTGVDPADVDVMMGTFTKSFGSCGGYIAASRDVIQLLRAGCPAHLYATSMSPPAAQQIVSALQVLTGQDGTQRGPEKIRQLHSNSNLVRDRLEQAGCKVLGDRDSPVLPMMVYQPSKLAAASRLCWERQLALVVVGFPATPVLTARARICISAAHTSDDLEHAVRVLTEVARLCCLQYRSLPHSMAQTGLLK